MTEDDTAQQANDRRFSLVADILVGALELITLFITIVSTAVAMPPADAPSSRYEDLISVYTDITLPVVSCALIYYLVRRRWIALLAQLVVVIAALISIVLLHKVRVSGGLTGY